MLLKYFYDDRLAQAAYMVGCSATGVAMVIDPARDITPYLEAAAAEGLEICYVAETHIHADFVSGSRELAARTGATLYLSDTGDANWKYQFAGANTVLLNDGDAWMVGSVRVEVIATPGHTPEHIMLQITDTATTDKPLGLFTGDCLFVGAVGRPDLLEKATAVEGTMIAGAREQYQNIARLRQMPDWLQVWPGHGAGSACGKALGALPSTTLGYEKHTNHAFALDTEDTFVEWLLEDQPEPPAYFAQMKKVNKKGPALLVELPIPEPLTRDQLAELLDAEAQIVDTRDAEAFADHHLAGTISIPSRSSGFCTYAGWLVDYARPVYLIAPQDQISRILHDLRAVGVDDVRGFYPAEQLDGATAILARREAAEVAAHRDQFHIIDVRNKAEVDERYIPGSQHIFMGYLAREVANIPREKPLVLYCATGIRSHIGASVLAGLGFENVANLDGGIDAWQAAGYPVTEGTPAAEPF
ncbi:MAG: MBL fold metallo-hydrolase [Chloroflexi bacterium]|nr:MBL fold metallo-hydrolase [Chloroflexota bacterium]